MSESERLLLHFDEGELCGGFSFCREFMLRIVPDELLPLEIFLQVFRE